MTRLTILSAALVLGGCQSFDLNRAVDLATVVVPILTGQTEVQMPAQSRAVLEWCETYHINRPQTEDAQRFGIANCGW